VLFVGRVPCAVRQTVAHVFKTVAVGPERMIRLLMLSRKAFRGYSSRATTSRVLTTRAPVSDAAADPATSKATPFVRAFRVAAVGTVVLAAANIMPAFDAMTVPRALALLDAKDRMIVRSGAHRMVAAVRWRPARRNAFLQAGAVDRLKSCILRAKIEDSDLSSAQASADIRRTRESIFEALLELHPGEGAKERIRADQCLMKLIEDGCQESDAARRLRQALADGSY
jgi:hypothetical protein